MWGKLVCTGHKEAEPNREIELTTEEFVVGRKESCQLIYSKDNTISAVHCKISISRSCGRGGEEDYEEGSSSSILPTLTAWVQDCSVNGTFLNNDKLMKGEKVQLNQNDEIGLLKPCRGSTAPPYAFIYHVSRPAHPYESGVLTRVTFPTPGLYCQTL